MSDEAGARELRGLVQELIRNLQIYQDFETRDGERLPMSHAHALALLATRYDGEDERPTLSELAEDLAIDKSNVTRMCRRMEEAGHAVLEPCRVDRRSKRIRLTPKGEAMGQRINEQSLDFFAEVQQGLGAERARSLRQSLNEFVSELLHVRKRHLPEEDVERGFARLARAKR